LATKAGKTVSGEESCEKALKRGNVKLVLVAQDASDNTKKHFTNMCKYRGVDIRIFGEKNLLGKYTGKVMRAVVGILDENFSKQLIKLIDNQNSGTGGV
jgi:ribosomal protein L7Ae-like RNA K-turn-binding protein